MPDTSLSWPLVDRPRKFIDEILGSKSENAGDPGSCTTTIRVSQVFELGNHRLALIDTPGFDNTEMNDSLVLTDIAEWLAKLSVPIIIEKQYLTSHSYVQKERIIGIIYLQAIENTRTGALMRNIEIFRKTVGKSATHNVVIATTKWDIISPEVAERRHKRLSEENKLFGGLGQQGAYIMKSEPGRRSEVVQEILDRSRGILSLKIQKEMVDSRKTVLKTGAGKTLGSDIKRSSSAWLLRDDQVQKITKDGGDLQGWA